MRPNSGAFAERLTKSSKSVRFEERAQRAKQAEREREREKQPV